MIKLSRLRKVRIDSLGISRLSCLIEIPAVPSDELWFEIPLKNEAMLTEDCYDGVLAAVLMIAMTQKENIEVQGACSKVFFENTRKIMDLFHFWFPKEFYPVDIYVEHLTDADRLDRPGAGARACFFSGGVDSFCSLIRSKASSSALKITHLLTVHGFDVPWKKTGLFEHVNAINSSIAKEFGAEYIQVKTNLRQFSDPFVDWAIYYEAGLACMGLCLSNGFSSVLIPATDVRDTPQPLGADSGLDKLWGNGFVEFNQDSADFLRWDKIRNIFHYPVVLKTLRVCWQNKDGFYNCSRCEKCLRTMTVLYLLDAHRRAETFDFSHLFLKILSLFISTRKSFYWKQMIPHFRKRPSDFLLLGAVFLAIGKSRLIELKRSLGKRK